MSAHIPLDRGQRARSLRGRVIDGVATLFPLPNGHHCPDGVWPDK